MRVVLDTNVIVSAHLSPLGAPARILECWRQRRFEVCVSEEVLMEYQRALLYDRVATRHGLGEHGVAAVVAGFRRFGVLVVPRDTVNAVTADPDDDKFLACAEGAAADYIVSGDAHLRDLISYLGIQILPPAGFLSLLRE